MPTLLFLGGWEYAIILVVALLLFGGSRLAGLGKGVGRSIREFKEEVKGVDDGRTGSTEVVDAEIVQPEIDRNRPQPPPAYGQPTYDAQRPQTQPYDQNPPREA